MPALAPLGRRMGWPLPALRMPERRAVPKGASVVTLASTLWPMGMSVPPAPTKSAADDSVSSVAAGPVIADDESSNTEIMLKGLTGCSCIAPKSELLVVVAVVVVVVVVVARVVVVCGGAEGRRVKMGGTPRTQRLFFYGCFLVIEAHGGKPMYCSTRQCESLSLFFFFFCDLSSFFLFFFFFKKLACATNRPLTWRSDFDLVNLGGPVHSGL